MESLAGVVKELYTSFLLRDFAGKIVPGIFLLLSFAALFQPIEVVLRSAAGRVTTAILALIAGLSWTIMLGLQSVAERLKFWSYYPKLDGNGKPLIEMDAQAIVQKFLHLACQVDKQQYERFVVIKEATGNLFVSFVLSVPFILLSVLIFWEEGFVRTEMVGTPSKLVRCLLVCAIAMLLAQSLFWMNHDHVEKQYRFVEKMMEDYSGQPCKEPASEEKTIKK